MEKHAKFLHGSVKKKTGVGNKCTLWVFLTVATTLLLIVFGFLVWTLVSYHHHVINLNSRVEYLEKQRTEHENKINIIVERKIEELLNEKLKKLEILDKFEAIKRFRRQSNCVCPQDNCNPLPTSKNGNSIYPLQNEFTTEMHQKGFKGNNSILLFNVEDIQTLYDVYRARNSLFAKLKQGTDESNSLTEPIVNNEQKEIGVLSEKHDAQFKSTHTYRKRSSSRQNPERSLSSIQSIHKDQTSKITASHSPSESLATLAPPHPTSNTDSQSQLLNEKDVSKIVESTVTNINDAQLIVSKYKDTNDKLQPPTQEKSSKYLRPRKYRGKSSISKSHSGRSLAEKQSNTENTKSDIVTNKKGDLPDYTLSEKSKRMTTVLPNLTPQQPKTLSTIDLKPRFGQNMSTFKPETKLPSVKASTSRNKLAITLSPNSSMTVVTPIDNSKDRSTTSTDKHFTTPPKYQNITTLQPNTHLTSFNYSSNLNVHELPINITQTDLFTDHTFATTESTKSLKSPYSASIPEPQTYLTHFKSTENPDQYIFKTKRKVITLAINRSTDNTKPTEKTITKLNLFVSPKGTRGYNSSTQASAISNRMIGSTANKSMSFISTAENSMESTTDVYSFTELPYQLYASENAAKPIKTTTLHFFINEDMSGKREVQKHGTMKNVTNNLSLLQNEQHLDKQDTTYIDEPAQSDQGAGVNSAEKTDLKNNKYLNDLSAKINETKNSLKTGVYETKSLHNSHHSHVDDYSYEYYDDDEDEGVDDNEYDDEISTTKRHQAKVSNNINGLMFLSPLKGTKESEFPNPPQISRHNINWKHNINMNSLTMRPNIHNQIGDDQDYERDDNFSFDDSDFELSNFNSADNSEDFDGSDYFSEQESVPINPSRLNINRAVLGRPSNFIHSAVPLQRTSLFNKPLYRTVNQPVDFIRRNDFSNRAMQMQISFAQSGLINKPLQTSPLYRTIGLPTAYSSRNDFFNRAMQMQTPFSHSSLNNKPFHHSNFYRRLELPTYQPILKLDPDRNIFAKSQQSAYLPEHIRQHSVVIVNNQRLGSNARDKPTILGVSKAVEYEYYDSDDYYSENNDTYYDNEYEYYDDEKIDTPVSNLELFSKPVKQTNGLSQPTEHLSDLPKLKPETSDTETLGKNISLQL